MLRLGCMLKMLKIASMGEVDVDDNGKLVALGSQFGIMALLGMVCALKVAW